MNVTRIGFFFLFISIVSVLCQVDGPSLEEDVAPTVDGENSEAVVVSNPEENNTTSPNETSISSCPFVTTSPRYYTIKAEASLLGVQDDVLVVDALIRFLRSLLLVAKCQLSFSEGNPCVGGTEEVPCPDPAYRCGENITITSEIYETILSGDCSSESPTSNTLFCNFIRDNPAVSSSVLSGSCRPFCISSPGSQIPVSVPQRACSSFQITIEAPTFENAETIVRKLVSKETKEAISKELTAFSVSEDESVDFVIVTSQIEGSVGWGYFPPPPPPLKPILPSGNDVNSENGDSLNNVTESPNVNKEGTLIYGPWNSCMPSCGVKGFTTRTVQCISSNGVLLEISACSGGEDIITWQECNEPCPDSYWEYGKWSKCNATCGGGLSTRTAVCQSKNGDCKENEKEVTTKRCNTAPCETHSWKVSEWGPCSNECGGGKMSRNVICVNGKDVEVDKKSCQDAGLEKPQESKACNTKPCDFCENNKCLGRGTCEDNKCICRDGYYGGSCEFAPSCSSSAIDNNLACCPSGLVDINGNCCPMDSNLDNQGQCCSQEIDRCGECGGSGISIDFNGECCASLDANGICCPSGMVDDCGVCDGLGDSCDIVMKAFINVPSEWLYGSSVNEDKVDMFFDDVFQGLEIDPNNIQIGRIYSTESTQWSDDTDSPKDLMTDIPTMSSVNAMSGPAVDTNNFLNETGESIPLEIEIIISSDANYTSEVLSPPILIEALANTGNTSESSDVTLVKPPEISRRAVCGNSICEIGERPTEGLLQGTCPEDCNVAPISCAEDCGVGGKCLPASGVCECNIGYEGKFCEDCSDGYIKNEENCIVDVVRQELVNENVVKDGEALVTGELGGTDESKGSGTSAGVIVLAVFGGIAGLVVLVLAFLALRRYVASKYGLSHGILHQKRRNMDGRPSYDHGSDQSWGNAELGLRERYGNQDIFTKNDVIPQKGIGGDGMFHIHVDGTGVNQARLDFHSVAARRTASESDAFANDNYEDNRQSKSQRTWENCAPNKRQAVGTAFMANAQVQDSYQTASNTNSSSTNENEIFNNNSNHSDVASEKPSKFTNPTFLSASLSHDNYESVFKDASTSIDTSGKLFFNPAFYTSEASNMGLGASVNPAYKPRLEPTSPLENHHSRSSGILSKIVENDEISPGGSIDIQSRLPDRSMNSRSKELHNLKKAVKELEERQNSAGSSASDTSASFVQIPLDQPQCNYSTEKMHFTENEFCFDHAGPSFGTDNTSNPREREYAQETHSPGKSLKAIFNRNLKQAGTPSSRTRNDASSGPVSPKNNSTSPYQLLMAKIDGVLKRKR